ncbi:MAG: hypothetical protein R2838_05635 [Caldilineaceae bacterium]
MDAHAHAALNIWVISPYHTGSHRAWAVGYQQHSAGTRSRC